MNANRPGNKNKRPSLPIHFPELFLNIWSGYYDG